LAGALAVRGRARVAAALVGLLLGALGLEAYVLEPRRLEVVVTKVAAPRGLAFPRPFKIALVADIQSDRIGAYEERALETVAATHPDLLVLAGDFLQTPDHARFLEEATRL